MADLEQLELPWMELMQSKDPEFVAMGYRLLLAHLVQTSQHLQIASEIQKSEQLLQGRLGDRSTAWSEQPGR